MSLSAGEHYMMVSKWLGHATFTVTLNVYGDYIPEDEGGTQNCLAEGTNHLLLAIYNELRHGHDQEAATLGNLTAAIETLSDRLGEGR